VNWIQLPPVKVQWGLLINTFHKGRQVSGRVEALSASQYVLYSLQLVNYLVYEGVTKSFRTGRLESELQMVHLSATRCSCIAILWVSL